jgi:2-dehydro-3-deoxyphosphogluconate aldolase/(4S)-4-hydroxy-2-oxoglutarate aldolase
MTKDKVRARIEEIGIIPSVRLSSAKDALFAAETVSNAGIPIVEVTMTVPGALDVIHAISEHYPQMIVGAGTVLDIDTAAKCLESGAKFITTPGLDLEVVRFAKQQGALVFPGVLTPSEIMAAWNAGSDLVKIFPCSAVGGPHYLRSIKGPFPEIPMIASGGVTQQNAGDYVRAGAVALDIGANLIEPEAIRQREKGWIMELAQRFRHIVAQSREEL